LCINLCGDRWKETRSHLKIEKSELLRSVLLFINVVAQIVLTVVAVPSHAHAGTTDVYTS
jgi:hypothetical protein